KKDHEHCYGQPDAPGTQTRCGKESRPAIVETGRASRCGQELRGSASRWRFGLRRFEERPFRALLELLCSAPREAKGTGSESRLRAARARRRSHAGANGGRPSFETRQLGLRIGLITAGPPNLNLESMRSKLPLIN